MIFKQHQVLYSFIKMKHSYFLCKQFLRKVFLQDFIPFYCFLVLDTSVKKENRMARLA